MKLLTVAALLALTVSASAQQMPPPQSSMDQAIIGKLMDEINSNIQLRAQVLQAQSQIRDLQSNAEAKKTEPKR